MDYRKTATEIVRLVGGEGNVSHFEHCSTRLRFTLVDQKKADVESLKRVPGVLGVAIGAQCQVIIGNSVVEVYDEILKTANLGSEEAKGGDAAQKQSVGATVMDFVIGVFQPVVPAIAGGGVLKAMLSLFVMIGIMDKGSSVYSVFNSIGDAALYFLPLLVAVSAARKLKCNQMVAMAAAGTLILPNITTLLTAEGGTEFFGFTLQNIAYSYQIFPALLTVFWLAAVEKFFNKVTPKPIRIFFVPLMCFVIVVPTTLLLLGPLGFNIGTLLTTVILALHDKLGFVALGVLAMALPFCIATGMHKAFLPYAISTYSALGYEVLYLPASLAHNIAESGACFGVAFRTKDKDLRSTAISAGISALFGITEPALYGVTLQNKRVLFGVVTGSGLAGLAVGLFAVKAFAVVGPGLASMAMYVDPGNSMNIVYAFAGLVIAFAISLIATLIFFKDGERKNSDAAGIRTGAGLKTAEEGIKDIVLGSPLTGRVIPMEQVKDPVFSGKVLGDGLAIVPEKGELRAPADGTVCMVADSKHAIGMELVNGAEILMHVGLDTVRLEGKYFNSKISMGDTVKAGQVLLTFDIDKMKEEGFDLTTPVFLSNGNRFSVTPIADGPVKQGDSLYMAVMKEE